MFKKLLSISIYIAKNWYKYWVKFLTIINKVKIFNTPCYIIYDPSEFDYKIRGEHIRDIEGLLEPGDIVFRSYDHYLDGFLIPGKFQHSGIYIGNNKIIDAISTGVREIDVIDFFQADKALVVRPNFGQDKAIERVKKWVGKSYDFKFNSEDSEEFYCHELTANAYKELNFKKVTPKLFGITFSFLSPRYISDSIIDNEHINNIFGIE